MTPIAICCPPSRAWSSAASLARSRCSWIAGAVAVRRDIATPLPALRQPEPAIEPVTVPRLVMENGIGGFTPDGREYVVVLDGDRETPLPWSNVLANPEFGTMVSSGGAAFTLGGEQPREPPDAVCE